MSEHRRHEVVLLASTISVLILAQHLCVLLFQGSKSGLGLRGVFFNAVILAVSCMLIGASDKRWRYVPFLVFLAIITWLPVLLGLLAMLWERKTGSRHTAIPLGVALIPGSLMIYAALKPESHTSGLLAILLGVVMGITWYLVVQFICLCGTLGGSKVSPSGIWRRDMT